MGHAVLQVGSCGVEASWAGGRDGREVFEWHDVMLTNVACVWCIHVYQVIDKLIPHVPKLLSSNGVFYLVLIEENKPGKLIQYVYQGHKVNFTVALGPHDLTTSLCYATCTVATTEQHSQFKS